MDEIKGFPELTELHRALVRAFGTPTSLTDDFTGPWPEERSRRVLTAEYQEIDPSEYFGAFDGGETSQKVYFLARALARLRIDNDSAVEVADHVIFWVAECCKEDLVAAGLYERVLEEIALTFWSWLDRYVIVPANPNAGPYVQGSRTPYVAQGFERDSFLDDLCRSNITSVRGPLADEILRKLADQDSNEKHSAHFLDMVQTMTEDPWRCKHLQTNAVFRSCASDRELLLRHWRQARPLIERTDPGGYAELMRRMVEAPRG